MNELPIQIEDARKKKVSNYLTFDANNLELLKIICIFVLS